MPPERFRADETPAEDVVAACEALSFAGLRLVVVDGADAWKAADAAPLSSRTSTRPTRGPAWRWWPPAPLTPKLHAAVAALGRRPAATAPTPRPRRRERTKWFVEHFARGGARAAAARVSPALARAVVERVMVDRADARKGGVIAMELRPRGREAGRLRRRRADHGRDGRRAGAAPPRRQGLRAGRRAGRRPTPPAPTTCCRTWRPARTRWRRSWCRCSWPTASASLAQAQALGPDPSPDAVAAATGMKGYPARDHRRAGAARCRPGAAQHAVARLAALELDLRVSELARLGRSRDDGERLVLETAARDLLALARGGRPAPGERSLGGGGPLGDAGHAALLARSVVAVNDALGGGAIDQVLQLAGPGPDLVGVPALDAASSRRRNRVLIVERYLRLRSRCSSERRLRFFCCLMFATRGVLHGFGRRSHGSGPAGRRPAVSDTGRPARSASAAWRSRPRSSPRGPG